MCHIGGRQCLCNILGKAHIRVCCALPGFGLLGDPLGKVRAAQCPKLGVQLARRDCLTRGQSGDLLGLLEAGEHRGPGDASRVAEGHLDGPVAQVAKLAESPQAATPFRTSRRMPMVR